MTPIGETFPSEGSHDARSFDGAGRYVIYQMAYPLVDADFVVACDGKRLGAGHATSWQDGDSGGTAQCGVRTGDKTRVADMALQLAC